MIFVDVIKLVTGRLRPIFLEICDVNTTLCSDNGNWGGDELCLNKDDLEIRHARYLKHCRILCSQKKKKNKKKK